MNSRWKKIEEALGHVIELAPNARGPWLDEFCAGEDDMRAEIDSLLNSHSAAEEFLEHSVAPYIGRLLQDEIVSAVPEKVGRYSIKREVGRGGMGVVYLAEREDEFRQQVAIKVVKRGLDTEDILRRFHNERQILASLNHPNIAKIFDGGMTDGGLPYFVMEYIKGEPLTKYCDAHSLSVEERLDLFRRACAAVQHAHQNLIVHRDLKPSNILVTSDREVKLLDFGIAKMLSADPLDSAPTMTQAAQRVMTPEYASPEQLLGLRVTTATDVYSLGVVAYELLTGTKPYKLKDTTPEELSRAICETEPTKPSAAISRQLSAASSSNGDSKAEPQSEIRNPKFLRGDLDNIILMALRKEPERRYKSVEQLSEDIRRHVVGLPVIARKDTFAYRSSKFVQRNRLAVTAAVLVLVAIIGGLITTVWQARAARLQRDRAQVQQAKAERISNFLTAALSYSNPLAAQSNTNRREATINQMLDDVAPRIQTELADQPEVRATLERIIGGAYFAQTRLDDAERFLNSALETQLKIYGEDHLETAITIASLGVVKQARGDWATAGKTYQRALAVFRSQQQKGRTDVKAMVETLDHYGSVLWSTGDIAGAESVYRESIALASRLEGRERLFIAGSKLGLGSVLYAQGRLAEAESLTREAVSEYRSQNAQLALATSINPFAQVLMWEKKYDEALTLLRESKAITRTILGENNFTFGRSLFLEAYTLALKGDYAEAEVVANQYEEVLNRNFPNDKASKANLYDTRALILTRSARAAQGEKFGQMAAEFYQSFQTRGASGITLARMHWAESLTAQKKYDAAEKILLEAYKDASEVYGTQFWRAKDVALELARLYETLHKPDLAAKYQAALN